MKNMDRDLFSLFFVINYYFRVYFAQENYIFLDLFFLTQSRNRRLIVQPKRKRKPEKV